MRLFPTLCAVVPFLSLAAFAEPAGPEELVGPVTTPGFPSTPATVIVTGKVFFDLDEDGVQDLPVGMTDEVGVVGFRVRVLKDGVLLGIGETDVFGCYSIEVEKKGKPKGYAVEIHGPTGFEGRFGFLGESPPVIGANWLLTNNQTSIVLINIRASEPGVDAGGIGEAEGVLTPEGLQSIVEVPGLPA